MDHSADYIDMCTKAIELQKDHKQCLWDTIYDPDWDAATGFDSICVNSVLTEQAMEESCYPHEIWLPRQDQLQEIYGKHEFGDDYDLITNKAHTILDIFQCAVLEGCENHDIVEHTFFMTSIEQLWLAFVMKEKYNKIWDREQKDWMDADIFSK